jgi:putative inorganic carbon (HCO3(-)) transporter
LLTLSFLGVFLLAQSRSATLAFALSLVFLLWVLAPPWGRLTLAGLLLVGVIGLAILVRSAGMEAIGKISLGGAPAEGETASLDTLENRVELWSRAVYAIRDFPLTGMGMNVFRHSVHRLYPLFQNDPQVDPAHAHNEFLQAALDLGIPGLAAFITLHAGAFAMLVGLARRSRNFPTTDEATGIPLNILLIGLGGGLVAHLIFGMADAVTLGAKPGVLFWMLLGLIASLYSRFSSGGKADLRAFAPPGASEPTRSPQPQGPGAG